MSTPAASIEGLTSRPAAESGTTLTGTITGLQGGETIVHRWRANGTAITGADGPSFTPEIGVNVADLDTLTYNPTVDGTEIASAAGTVRFAPPVFTVQPTLGASSFTAGDIVTLTAGVAPQADLSISTLTLGGVDKSGEVSLLTWDTGGEAAGPIAYQVTAWNSGGATLSDVVVATLSAADTTAPVVTNAAVNTVPDPNELTFDVDEDGSLYYLVNQSATPLAGATIEAGGGDLSGGPFSVVNGSVTQNIDLSSLTASTTYQMHFTVKDAAGNYSTDTVVEFTTEAAAPAAWTAPSFVQAIADFDFSGGDMTFPGIDLGPGDPDLHIDLLLHWNLDLTGVAIGGVAATLHEEINTSGARLRRYRASVSAGGVVDIVVQGPSLSRVHGLVLRSVNSQVLTPAPTASGGQNDVLDCSADVAAGDAAVLVMAAEERATGIDLVGVTELYDQSIGSNDRTRLGLGIETGLAAATPLTLTATPTGPVTISDATVAMALIYRQAAP